MKVSIALISTLLLLILKSTPLFAAPCDEALVRATLTSGKAVQKDWRIALMVTRGVYDEIKHSGGAGAEIGGVPLGANYEDFHNRVENLKNSTNESYAMSDIRNIAWSGLDPNAVNVYSKCLDAEVLQSNGLNAAILAGTNKEIAIRVHWFLPAEPKPAHVTWTPPSIEGTVIPQRRLIPLSQVNQNLVLAGQIRNGAGFEFFGRS